MTRLAIKSGHKKDTFYNEIGQFAHNKLIIFLNSRSPP